MANTDSTAPRTTYEGNCHCGAVRFSLVYPSLEETEVSSCNCSICITNGYLMIYPAKLDFKYTRGEDSLASYFFGQKELAHYFCKICGTSLNCIDTSPPPNDSFLAVNVRTLKGIDIAKLKLKYATDGKDLLPPYDIGP